MRLRTSELWARIREADEVAERLLVERFLAELDKLLKVAIDKMQGAVSLPPRRTRAGATAHGLDFSELSEKKNRRALATTG